MDIKIYFLLAVFCISSTNAIHQLEEWKQWNFSRVEQQQTDMETGFAECVYRNMDVSSDVTTVITLCGQTSKFAVRLPEAYLQSAGRSYAVDFSCFKENTFGLTNLRRPHEMINPNWNQDEICKFFETKLFPDFCKIKRACPGNSAPSAKFGDYYGYAKMVLLSHIEKDRRAPFSYSIHRFEKRDFGFECPSFSVEMNPKLFEYGTKIGKNFQWMTKEFDCRQFI